MVARSSKRVEAPAGMAKAVPKGAHVVLIQRRAHASTRAMRKGKLRAGISKSDALRMLLRLAKTWSDTAVVVDGKGKIILSAKGGKRGGKTKTSASIAKIAATTTGQVQLRRRPSDGAVMHSKSATKSAISSWKSMPRGSYLNVLGASRRFFGPVKGGAARKTSKKASKSRRRTSARSKKTSRR